MNYIVGKGAISFNVKDEYFTPQMYLMTMIKGYIPHAVVYYQIPGKKL